MCEDESRAVPEEFTETFRSCVVVLASYVWKGSSLPASVLAEVGTFESQPGTREVLGCCSLPSSSAFRSPAVMRVVGSGLERAEPMSLSVSERTPTCIEGATAGMWRLSLGRNRLPSARRSSTIVLSSSTSFSTSESPGLPKELLDWFEGVRCSRAPVLGRSVKVNRLDDVLMSLECCL